MLILSDVTCTAKRKISPKQLALRGGFLGTRFAYGARRQADFFRSKFISHEHSDSFWWQLICKSSAHKYTNRGLSYLNKMMVG